jgi:deoxyribodipyrimidine photo-lyase
MLVSIGVHHLGLDWRAAGWALARVFTDYEAGIHWSQVQMQSGVTGINAPRLYNPVKQGHDHDPTGAFIRRWLPELAPVPDLWLHEPWKWAGAGSLLGKRYPEPLADPVTAARAARARIGEMRRQPGFRAASAQVVEKPGSRREHRHPLIEGPPRGSAQLSLDL